MKRTIVVTRLLIAMCLVMWCTAAWAVQVASIRVSELNVRSGPGNDYRVLFRLAKKTQVRVLDRRKGWLKIDHNGRTGFISGSRRFVRITTVNESAADPSPAPVPGAPSSELKEQHQTAEKLQERLRTSERQLAQVSDKEQAVLEEVHAIERALDKARRQVREARSALAMLNQKVSGLEQDYAALETQITAGRAYAAQRLAALYKVHWLGRIHLLATADSFFDFINRKVGLERILAQDEQVLEKLRSDQIAVEGVLEQLGSARAEQQATEIKLTRRIQAMDGEQHRRAQLLEQVRSEKTLALAAVNSLKEAAHALNATFNTLTPVAPPARPAESLAGVDNRPFNTHKGLLHWPVKGKIVSFFGPYRDEKTNVVNFQSGINISAERGEPIRAVSDGYTIFANWFKGFGNMMIIDHGDHYYTVYAHLEEVFKVKGDRVESGEVIATLGDSGSLTGPALHFEVRHHGKPVDPLEWINKG